jgi:hypothetical protein
MTARLPLATCLALCLAILFSGCAGPMAGPSGERAPVMTLSDFSGFCSALPTPGACLSDPVCQRYRQELAAAPAELPACLALCQRLETVLYDDNLVNGCGAILDRAQALCDQFCRRRDGS